MMNTSDVLEQSHTAVMQAVDDLSEDEWDVPGVCGEWSVKEVIAHLASYERLLLDMIHTLQGDEVTPYIRTFLANGQAFNEEMVGSRQFETAQQVLDEYEDAQVQTTSALATLPQEKIQQVGTMPWYHADRCLADVITTFCDHSQQHSSQIINFRKRVDKPSSN